MVLEFGVLDWLANWNDDLSTIEFYFDVRFGIWFSLAFEASK
jgi:hypothetical protein